MLSLIQNEVVVSHAWMSNAQFADIVAVSQITPAPSPSIRPPTWATPWDCRPAARCGAAGLGDRHLRGVSAVAHADDPRGPLLHETEGQPHRGGRHAGMRPAVIGMIAAAALLLIFPHNAAPGEGTSSTTGASWAPLCAAGLGAGGSPPHPWGPPSPRWGGIVIYRIP